jgi:hypothetical protein
VGILDRFRNKKVSLNDLKNIDGTKKEIESQLAHQKKEEKKKLYKIKCEKCKTEIKLKSIRVQRVYCPNYDCLRKYKVKISLPSDNEVKTGSLTAEEWIKGNIDNSLKYEVEKPVFEVNHIGYAWEDRRTFPASKLSSKALILRIEESKRLNNQNAINEDVMELMRRSE